MCTLMGVDQLGDAHSTVGWICHKRFLEQLFRVQYLKAVWRSARYGLPLPRPSWCNFRDSQIHVLYFANIILKVRSAFTLAENFYLSHKFSMMSKHMQVWSSTFWQIFYIDQKEQWSQHRTLRDSICYFRPAWDGTLEEFFATSQLGVFHSN